MRPATPPPAPTTVVISEIEDTALPKSQPRSTLPALEDILAEEEHEVSIRRRRVCRKLAVDSASKARRSRRLVAKENPLFEDATTKAARVQSAKLDLSRDSAAMVAALEHWRSGTPSSSADHPISPSVSGSCLRHGSSP